MGKFCVAILWLVLSRLRSLNICYFKVEEILEEIFRSCSGKRT